MRKYKKNEKKITMLIDKNIMRARLEIKMRFNHKVGVLQYSGV